MESKDKSNRVATTPAQDGADEINSRSAPTSVEGEENKSKRKLDVEEPAENSLKKPPPIPQQQPPSSPQQGHLENATKKRPRKECPPLQSSQGQLQISEIWNRYDLTDPELTSDYERAELESVQKQIWKPKKFVPYTGLSSLQS